MPDAQDLLRAKGIRPHQIERTEKMPGHRVLTGTRCVVIRDDGGADDPSDYRWPDAIENDLTSPVMDWLLAVFAVLVVGVALLLWRMW